MARGTMIASTWQHRLQVLAPVETGGADEYGHAQSTGTPDLVYSDLRCLAWMTTERTEAFSETTQGSVEVLRVITDRDAAIDHRSVLVDVRDRRGMVVFSGPFRVLGVTRKADHIVITARHISPGRA